MNFDTNLIREQFPGLTRPAIFFDNPGGTQIAKPSLDRMIAYLVNSNANHAGRFATSKASDAIIDEAHQAAADFLNARRAEEIVFGANMTTLTLHFSRTLARTWNPDDKILVTRLDHDANVTPWVMAAQDRGCQIHYVDFNLEDGTLNTQQLYEALEDKPRLVAVGYSSNALGTINPLKEIVKEAHAAGALVYVDAVHYAPHGPIDVQDLDCDFLVCSAYKFFGPHVGILYGRYELLDQLTAYKVRPAPQDPPGKFETGTGNFEGFAGVLGAIEYFEWLGENFGAQVPPGGNNHRRSRLQQAMIAVREYEARLCRALLLIPLLQIVSVIATLWLLLRWHLVPERRPTGGREWGLHVLVPLIPNVLAALMLRPMLGKRRGYLRLYMPDYALIARVSGGFSLVWSFLHIGLVLKGLRGKTSPNDQ